MKARAPAAALLGLLAALALAIGSADAATAATASRYGGSGYQRSSYGWWQRWRGRSSWHRPKPPPAPDALPGGLYILELDDSYRGGWEEQQGWYKRGLLSWDRWWKGPSCKAPGGALTARACSAPAATVNKLYTAPLPRWRPQGYGTGRGVWAWDAPQGASAAAASSLEVADSAGNATAAAATLVSTASYGSSGGGPTPSSPRQQFWQLYPADVDNATAWADIRGARIRIVSDARAAETGACYKYTNIADAACTPAGSRAVLGPGDAPQWVVEPVPGQRGRYYIRQSTCSGAAPRYLGQAARGAVWQEPTQAQVQAELRWTSGWWKGHRASERRARGKWVCPEAGPALFARDARGAATRWKLTLRSATAPAILSVAQSAGQPSAITVVVSRASGPGNLVYRVIGTPATGPAILSRDYTTNAKGQLVFTFRSFQAGMLYTFRAQAGNGLGWGPQSAPATIVTNGPPPRPTILSVLQDGDNLVVELQAQGASGTTRVWLQGVGTPPPNLNVTSTATDLGGGKLRLTVTPAQGFVATSAYVLTVRVSFGGQFSAASAPAEYTPAGEQCPELPDRCLVQAPAPDCACTECVPGFQPDGGNPQGACLQCADPSPGFAGFATGCTLSGCIDGFWLDPAGNGGLGACNACGENCAQCAVSGAFGGCDLCSEGFGPVGEGGACAPCSSDTCSECRLDDVGGLEYCNVCKFAFTWITPEPGQPYSAECAACDVGGCQLCDSSGVAGCDRCLPNLLLDQAAVPPSCTDTPGCSQQPGCAYCSTPDGNSQVCSRCGAGLTNGGDAAAPCEACTQPELWQPGTPPQGACSVFADNADVACTCLQCAVYAPPFCAAPAGASVASAAGAKRKVTPAALAAQRRTAAASQVAAYKKRRRAGRRARKP